MRPCDFVGLDVLVGLTFFDSDGLPTRQEQFHGEFEAVRERAARVRPYDGGQSRWLPNDCSALRPAPGGVYRLASCDSVVVGPTLVTSWIYTPARDERGRACYDAFPNPAPIHHSRVPREWDFTYSWEEDRIRRAIALFGDEYIGRTLLFGLNILDLDGRLKRQEQHVGTIMRVDFDDGVLVATDRDELTFRLPADPALIERAQQGVYRLRSTGRVVRGLDYVAEYTTREPN